MQFWTYLYILFLGLLASPQSAPGNLDTGKSGDIKSSGTGGSRENSTVDFSKVIMSKSFGDGRRSVWIKAKCYPEDNYFKIISFHIVKRFSSSK